jgi:HEAT repeat protein
MHPIIRPIRPVVLLLSGLVLTGCVAGALAALAPPAALDRVKPLVAVLQSPAASQKEKADACRELARIGTQEAVAPLAALLPDYDLSHMARYGLETIPDPAVDQALRDAAGKLHGRLLIGVIGSIGVRRDSQAVELLAKYLRSPNPEVAQAAARALGKIGNAQAATAIQAALPAELEANPAANSLPGNRRQAPLPTAWDANKLAFCEGLLCCAEALSAKEDGKQAIGIYDRVLGMDMPHQVRTAALRGAILTRKQDGLPLLVGWMREGDFAAFAACMRISQEMPGTPVTMALAGELSTANTNRQMLLVRTLGNRQDPAAMPALLALAKDGQPPVRLAAIRAVPQIGDVSALPVLLDLGSDADKDVSAAAQDSLAALPGKQVDDAIIAMLNDTNTVKRLTAMDLIGRRRMTSAVTGLLAATKSSDPKTRTTAVKKLGELGGPAELPALLDLLAAAKEPEDLEATEQALNALCVKASDPANCVAKLEGRMTAAQPAQKCALVRVLAAVGGPKALAAVRTAARDPNAEVHSAAVRALGGWTTPDAAPDLLDLAKSANNSTDKMICLRGYLRLAGQAELPTDKRLAMCRQASSLAQKDDEKKLLLAALGGIPSVEALDLIAPYLDQEGTKEEAATAAVEVSGKLVKAPDAAKTAARLAEVLDKVSSATANSDLAKRAKALRTQVKTKLPQAEASTK